MITPRSCLCHINTRRIPKKVSGIGQDATVEFHNRWAEVYDPLVAVCMRSSWRGLYVMTVSELCNKAGGTRRCCRYPVRHCAIRVICWLLLCHEPHSLMMTYSGIHNISGLLGWSHVYHCEIHECSRSDLLTGMRDVCLMPLFQDEWVVFVVCRRLCEESQYLRDYHGRSLWYMALVQEHRALPFYNYCGRRWCIVVTRPSWVSTFQPRYK